MTGFVDTVVFLALLGGLALLAWSPREVGATATFHPVSDRDATDAARSPASPRSAVWS